MIKVTYNNLNNPVLPEVMQKLSGCSDLMFGVSYNIRRIAAKLKTETNELKSCGQDIFKKYIQFEENGQPKVMDGKLVVKEGMEFKDFEAEMEKLMLTEFEINRQPLCVSDLSCVKLSPNDLGAIEFLLADEAEVVNLRDPASLEVVP